MMNLFNHDINQYSTLRRNNTNINTNINNNINNINNNDRNIDNPYEREDSSNFDDEGDQLQKRLAEIEERELLEAIKLSQQLNEEAENEKNSYGEDDNNNKHNNNNNNINKHDESNNQYNNRNNSDDHNYHESLDNFGRLNLDDDDDDHNNTPVILNNNKKNNDNSIRDINTNNNTSLNNNYDFANLLDDEDDPDLKIALELSINEAKLDEVKRQIAELPIHQKINNSNTMTSDNNRVNNSNKTKVSPRSQDRVNNTKKVSNGIQSNTNNNTTNIENISKLSMGPKRPAPSRPISTQTSSSQAQKSNPNQHSYQKSTESSKNLQKQDSKTNTPRSSLDNTPKTSPRNQSGNNVNNLARPNQYARKPIGRESTNSQKSNSSSSVESSRRNNIVDLTDEKSSRSLDYGGNPRNERNENLQYQRARVGMQVVAPAEDRGSRQRTNNSHNTLNDNIVRNNNDNRRGEARDFNQSSEFIDDEYALDAAIAESLKYN